MKQNTISHNFSRSHGMKLKALNQLNNRRLLGWFSPSGAGLAPSGADPGVVGGFVGLPWAAALLSLASGKSAGVGKAGVDPWRWRRSARRVALTVARTWRLPRSHRRDRGPRQARTSQRRYRNSQLKADSQGLRLQLGLQTSFGCKTVSDQLIDIEHKFTTTNTVPAPVLSSGAVRFPRLNYPGWLLRRSRNEAVGDGGVVLNARLSNPAICARPRKNYPRRANLPPINFDRGGPKSGGRCLSVGGVLCPARISGQSRNRESRPHRNRGRGVGSQNEYLALSLWSFAGMA